MPSVQRYVAHLHEACDSGRGISALAPCFILYAHVGRHYERHRRGAAVSSSRHPYYSWLSTYVDDAFQRSADQIHDLLHHSFHEDTFVTSAEMELNFWSEVLQHSDTL